MSRADRLNAVLSKISPALKKAVETGWGTVCPYRIDEAMGKTRITVTDPSDGEMYSAVGPTLEDALTRLEAKVSAGGA